MTMIEAQERHQAVACVLDVAAAVPAVIGVLLQHLADNFGEILPWILMGAYTDWAIQQDRLNTAESRVNVEAFFQTLERHFDKQSAGAWNVIAVGCLENLDQAGQRYDALFAHFGPRMKAAEAAHPHRPR